MPFDGGPAFPRAAFAPHDVRYEDVGIHDSQEGMTLRDYFAAAFLQGFAANPKAEAPPSSTREMEETTAELAYIYADAMIRARSAPPPPAPKKDPDPDF